VIRKILFAAAAAIMILFVVLLLLNTDMRGQGKLDRTDYLAVSESFIRNNVYIGGKIGKVTDMTHSGIGGDSGRESFNVFRLVGTDSEGILYLTVKKDEQGIWNPSEATLSVNGILMEVPFSRSTGEKWRSFRWKSR
jgi:hypothetical protein